MRNGYIAPRRDGWGGQVAIIGAGNGTDVAAALAYGAAHVDVVELDPMLASIGAHLRPNRPFADPAACHGRAHPPRAPRSRYDVSCSSCPVC